jgi:L-lactate utilization protein LutC
MSEAARGSAQGHVLDDIRRALGRSETLRPTPLEPFIETTGEAELEEIVARFTAEAIAVGAHVYRARSGADAVAHLAEICDAAGVGEVALSGAPLLAEMNLRAHLTDRRLSVVEAADFSPDERDKLIALLAGCGAGVTAVDDAIAETGTIVLSSDEEQGLLVSLLPAIHIAVLSRGQISGSLAAVIEKLGLERMRRSEPCRAATFITGPSRTSDVELTLSIGVHGPKELHLIILGE